MNGLEDALKRTAEQKLPAPTLADETMAIPAADAAELSRAAAEAGGSVVALTGAGEWLARIPGNNVEAFKAALRHQPAEMAAPAGPNRTLEILIQPGSPSPSP